MSKKLTKEEFIERAQKRHGNKYDYSLVQYNGNRIKVKIICYDHGEFWQKPSNHLFKSDCPICATENRKTSLSDFILKAKAVHKDRYIYDKVKYNIIDDKVIIICRLHGEFKQIARMHLEGHNGCKGCKKILSNSILNCGKEEFIKKANEAHNNKYTYEKTIYINNKTSIVITCPAHGDFMQAPFNHTVQEQGCPECHYEEIRLTLQEFINESKRVHGNKYDYNKSVYVNNRTNIEVICKEHGSFWPTPGAHMLGDICQKCSFKERELTQEEFLQKANFVHENKYDYSLSIYKGYRNKIIIICKEHGQFEQLASGHLMGGGCAECSPMISRGETTWLDSLDIPKEYRNRFIREKERSFNVDGINFSTKKIYEFYGDYYHGNPRVFDQNKLNKTVGKTFGELYQATLERERILKEAGWTIISIWEDEFNETYPG